MLYMLTVFSDKKWTFFITVASDFFSLFFCFSFCPVMDKLILHAGTVCFSFCFLMRKKWTLKHTHTHTLSLSLSLSPYLPSSYSHLQYIKENIFFTKKLTRIISLEVPCLASEFHLLLNGILYKWKNWWFVTYLLVLVFVECLSRIIISTIVKNNKWALLGKCLYYLQAETVIR